MSRIGLASVAAVLVATPLHAADVQVVVPPPPPAVAEEGAVVAPPPPACRAAVVSGLFVGPWIELSLSELDLGSSTRSWIVSATDTRFKCVPEKGSGSRLWRPTAGSTSWVGRARPVRRAGRIASGSFRRPRRLLRLPSPCPRGKPWPDL